MTAPTVEPGGHAGVPTAQQGGAVAVTPVTLVQMAVQQGAKAEELRALFELQRDWEKDQARKAYVRAFALFKANPPTVTKNKHVSFPTSKGQTEYHHATLENVSDTIGPALTVVGISHRWEVDVAEGRISVTCVLTHEQGHSERVSISAGADDSGGKNKIQAVGSTVSYLQRYTLLTATGIAVKGADDDGKGGNGMQQGALADWKAKIDELTNKDDGPALWKAIAKACDDAKDVPAFRELQPVYASKMKSLR